MYRDVDVKVRDSVSDPPLEVYMGARARERERESEC